MTHSKVTLQRDNFTYRGKVKDRNLSYDGSIISTWNNNNILNALGYNAEFEDGDVREQMSNEIGETMLTTTDADGNVTMVLQTILNHRKYETENELKDKHIYLNGKTKIRKSSQGWDLEAL